MRKKISIDRFVPRATLPPELHSDWLSSAAPPTRPEGEGTASERSMHIAG